MASPEAPAAQALLRLAIAAERREDDTGRHVVRVGVLCESVAQALGQPADWCTLLRGAAPLHDVGKIVIPASVLGKPGPLTSEERALMNTHSRIGAQILRQARMPLFEMAAEIALTHHERFGGGGYPDGLTGEAIPLSGRIVCAVDYVDALTMDRSDRPGFSDRKALEMLADGSGRLFDPQVVCAILDHAEGLLLLRDRVNAGELTCADLLAERPSPATVISE